MKITLPAIVLILGMFSFLGSSKSQVSTESPKLIERAIELPNKSELTHEPPDVLAATNIEQWKSLIRNLKKESSLPNFWRTGSPQGCVILKSNGQSIVYKMASVDVNVFNNAGDVLEAEIYTPKMDIVETREVGLKICKMFSFDATKFDAWCKSVGNNWLDSSLIDVGDNNHGFRILHSYNDQQPWIMIFIIQPEKTRLEFKRELEQQAQSSKPPNRSNTNDLVAVALRTHTKEAWQAALYQDIEDDPNPDGGSGIVFTAIYFIAACIVGVVAAFVSFRSHRGSVQCRRDVPGQIAKWSFMVGAIWAVLLIPITALCCVVYSIGFVDYLIHHYPVARREEWLICPYLLLGYAIWAGWGWRGHKKVSLKISCVFWLVSAGFNILQPIRFWIDAHSIWVFVYPLPLWSSVVTLASLVALSFEFFTPRHEDRAV